MFKFDDVHQLTDFEVENQRVFVRADFDCPSTSGGQIDDDAKLRAVVPTVRWLLDRKARVVIGAQRGPLGSKPSAALEIEECGAVLAGLLDIEILVPDENFGAISQKLLAEQRDKQLILLQNLAYDEGEAACDNDYARALIAPFDVFVTDCLGADEKSASLVTAPKMSERRAMGLHARIELEQFNAALSVPAAESLWFVGGAFPERHALLNTLLRPLVTVALGVRTSKTVLAARGADVRLDPKEQASLPQARTWLKKADDMGARVLLPTDLVCRNRGVSLERRVNELGAGGAPVELGSATLDAYRAALEACSNVWFVDALGTTGNLDATIALLTAAGQRAPSGQRPARTNVLLDAELTSNRAKAALGEGAAWLSSSKPGVLTLLTKQRTPALEALRIPL
jgi:phosphoglycerate kinase